MSEDTMMGQNEAYGRVKRMMGQSNSGRIEYPSGTNMRGSGGREHHAEGDMVGRENHACGDMVGSKKKNRSVGDVSAPPGHAGSMMKPHYGAPQGGREMGTRRQAISQVHGENHKAGDMVGREEHALGRMVGRMANRAGNAMQKAAGQAGRGMQKAAQATPGAMRQAGNAMQKAGAVAGSAMQGAAKAAPGAMRQAGNAVKNAMPPRPMYRRGGRAENMHDED